jgi:hypothetical protein
MIQAKRIFGDYILFKVNKVSEFTKESQYVPEERQKPLNR